MSFLNQVLASIGNGSPSVPTQAPPPRPSASRPSAQATNNQTRPTKCSESSDLQSALKRKAEDENGTGQTPQKMARTDYGPSGNKGIVKPRPVGSSGPSLSNTTPYKGTMNSATSKPPGANTSSSTTSTAQAAPKKGYLATLERAKAAQAAKSTVGVIKHKPIERVAKKDRLALKAEAVSRKKSATIHRPSPSDRDAKVDDSTKSRPKPTETGYKGTMRPSNNNATTYKGTMRPSSSSTTLSKPRSNLSSALNNSDRSRSSSLAAGRPREKTRMAGYASYSDGDSLDEEEEEEEEEEQEEEEGYRSNGSSDMEAGIDEMDYEEQASLRAARREDEEAAKEEQEAKTRKEARKKATLGAGRRL